MTEVVEQPTTAIAEYSPLEAGLADLRHRFENVVFDVTSSKGNTEARAARLELVRLRSALELKRVELKAPALERSRLIDTEATRIKKAILELETPIDAAIKAEEQRKEAKRQAKIDAERKRIADIQDRIAELRGHPSLPMQSALIAEHIEDLERIEVDDSFQEFRPAAEAAKRQGLERLRAQHAEALAREQEAERLAAESARLAAERRQAQAAHEAQMKAEREAAEVERKRLAAIAEEQRRQAEAAAAEERARQEAVDRARREEAARLAARAIEIEMDQSAATDDAVQLVREIAEDDANPWAERARAIVARLDVEITA